MSFQCSRFLGALTEDVLADLDGDVKALGVCEVHQQEPINREPPFFVLGSFKGELSLLTGGQTDIY